MDQHDEIVELLKRIEANQERALAAQQEHLAVAREQLERSARRLEESMELQRKAVRSQGQIRNFALPVIVLLVILLIYLLSRWWDRL